MKLHTSKPKKSSPCDDLIKKFRAVNKNDYKPLYVQLAESFVAYISENNLQPGAPFPSQSELCRIFDVSAMPIRHALQRVTSEGHLTCIQGKGTFVAESKLQFSPDRLMPLEAQLARQGHKVDIRLISAQLAHPIEKRRMALNLSPGEKTFRVQRLLSINSLPCCLEIWHMPSEFKKLFSHEDLHTQPMIDVLNRTDLPVAEIRYQIRSQPLLKLDAGWFNLPEATSALGLWFTVQGFNRPLATGRTFLRADKIELNLSVSRLNKPLEICMTT